VREAHRANYKAPFRWTPELVDAIAARCTEVESGARNVDHILTRTLLPEWPPSSSARMADGGTVSRAIATVGENGTFRYELS
jgi:type VI secretion system protein VasG